VLADRKALASYYRTPYIQQKENAYEPVFEDNIDAAVVDLATADLSSYKLLVIAGEYVMDKAAAKAVRGFVNAGGTAIMTAYSDKADGTGQWHASALPGGLSDVFGVRTSQFYTRKEPLTGTIGGERFTTTIHRYEVLEPTTARVLAAVEGIEGSPPVATVNRYGRGQAVYVAATAQPSVLKPLYRSLYASLGIARGPVTPEGVVAREVEGRTLYVNTTDAPIEVPLAGARRGRISGKRWTGPLRLDAYGVDLVE
jgi:beta-galactosidase